MFSLLFRRRGRRAGDPRTWTPEASELQLTAGASPGPAGRAEYGQTNAVSDATPDGGSGAVPYVVL